MNELKILDSFIRNMIYSIAQIILFLFSVMGVLAVPAHTPVNQPFYPRSSDFDKIRFLMANATLESDLEKRSTSFSSSQDGVDSAGFYYSLYNDNGAAVTYTEFDSGQFQIGWNLPSSTEFLGGKGYRGQIPKTFTWTGYFSATGDYTLALYGWTTNPVTEWYIVEQHGTGTPGNGNILGQVYSDGGTYDVYDLYYSNVPEIYGATSFHQYWSVRRSSRTTGTLTTGNHFQGWKNLGLNPGYTVFQMVTAEGFKGTGYLDFTVSYS